ncbi:hypothetical protein DMN91_000407 [Ooceraea biroi]|uniref:Neuropeptide Y n=2 Tax=Ooceraea biroi TaxID=2015173 RepID=A0A026VUH1_OOCBI|nr:hypothetical protein X777_16591 [Ooceraea biroi]RLU26611.1 hypothetical protein DMN91_000407 [Ooceraea biroi]
MRTEMSAARFLCCLLLIAIVGTVIACAEPESMARSTRPKVIANSEELKRYLDLVREYYSMTGTARFGKRNDPPISENTIWEIFRMILDNAQRQNEQRRRDRIRQNKEPVPFNDF